MPSSSSGTLPRAGGFRRPSALSSSSRPISPTAFIRVEIEGQTEHTRCLSLHVSDRFIAMDQALGAAEELRQAARLRGALCDALANAALREP